MTVWTATTLWCVAAMTATAATPGGRVTYRNGTLMGADVAHRLLAVDLGDGVVHLRAAEGVDVGALRAGDAVLIGIGEIEGRTSAVYVRTAGDTGGRALSPSSASGVPGAPRRPLHVIPNPRQGPPTVDAEEAPLAPGKVTASLSVVGSEPEPPPAMEAAREPSALEQTRDEGRRRLVTALESMDVLVNEVDQVWNQYVHACQPGGAAPPRGWLSLPRDATAAPGTCRDLLANVTKASTAVQQRLSEIEENARASSVMPGTVRAVLERYELRR